MSDKEEAARTSREIKKWVRSPEGQLAIREAIGGAMEAHKQQQRKRRVTTEIANRVFDI